MATDANASQPDLEVRETFGRASEFAPHVTMSEETFFSHGWQPLTISILQSLWFLPSDATFDIPFLVDWYARLGWKGANGKPMGENVVRREIGFIKKAGYVTVDRLRGENGQAVGIRYAVKQRRSDQPENGPWIPVLPGTEGIRRSDHMPPMPTRGESPHVGNGGIRRSDHMPPMPTRGESPHVGNDAKAQVAPRATNEVPPPLPPGGGTTPPPTPSAGGVRQHPSQTEEEGVFDAEEITAAEAFLQQLPDPWFVGRADAAEMAPRLLRRMRNEGWPTILAADLTLLAKCIATNDGGARNLVSIIRTKRIPNLPSYVRVVARSARKSAAPSVVAQSRLGVPAEVECGKGCDRGYIEIDDSVAPCSCLPLRHAAAGA